MNLIPTASAVVAYYEADAEWCRLSDLFNRVARSSTPKLKDRARAALADRERKLISDIIWSVGQRAILIYFQSKPSETLELPAVYTGSAQLSNALRNGQASSLRLTGADAGWEGARLVFERDSWYRWLRARKDERERNRTEAVSAVDKPILLEPAHSDEPLHASQTAASPRRQKSRAPQKEVDKWYRDYVKQHNPVGGSPNTHEDELAAREHFGCRYDRDKLRNARREFAPLSWRSRAKRRKARKNIDLQK